MTTRQLRLIMVRIEEVQDESEKIRQEGLKAGFNDDDEWEATDAESEEVRAMATHLLGVL